MKFYEICYIYFEKCLFDASKLAVGGVIPALQEVEGLIPASQEV